MKKDKGRSIIVVCLGIVFYIVIRFVYTIVHNPQTTAKTSIARYDSLFTKQAHYQLKFYSTILSKYRQPESLYIYKGEYYITVFSVPLLHATKIESIINYSDEISRINLNAVYSDRSGQNYEMMISESSTDAISKLNFKYSGNPIKIVSESDSEICYNLKFQTFSFSYNNQNNTYDVIAKANNTPVPANIEFIERGKLLYIMIITVSGIKGDLQPDLLHNITNK